MTAILLLLAAPVLWDEAPEAERRGRTKLEAPGVDTQIATASPTRRPFVVANGWQLRRRPGGRYLYQVPAGAGALAAAEAHAFGADAVLEIEPADRQKVKEMLRLLREVPAVPWPDLAQIGVVEDGSERVGDVMTLLSRRNLLWRPVAAPDPRLPVNVHLGSREIPAAAADDPSALAYRIRRKLTDARRGLRLYGSEVVLCRLQVEGGRARLQLLNYGGGVVDGLRVRVAGSYGRGTAISDRKARGATADHAAGGGATELTVPSFAVYAAVDLER